MLVAIIRFIRGIVLAARHTQDYKGPAEVVKAIEETRISDLDVIRYQTASL